MMQKRTQSAAFSLVELLVAMVAGAILAITGGTMIFHAYNAWDDNHAAVNVHRDGRNAMDLMSRAIRDASFARVVTARNNDLEIRNAAGTSSVRFQRSGRNLTYDPDTGVGGDEIDLVVGGATQFVATPSATAITIRLDLDRAGEAMRFDSVTAFRN